MRRSEDVVQDVSVLRSVSTGESRQTFTFKKIVILTKKILSVGSAEYGINAKLFDRL